MWEVGLEARWYSDVIACGRWKLGASLWRRKPYVADLVAMAIVRTKSGIARAEGRGMPSPPRLRLPWAMKVEWEGKLESRLRRFLKKVEMRLLVASMRCPCQACQPTSPKL